MEDLNTRLLTQEKKPFGLAKILYLLSNVLSKLEIDLQSRDWIAIRANIGSILHATGRPFRRLGLEELAHLGLRVRNIVMKRANKVRSLRTKPLALSAKDLCWRSKGHLDQRAGLVILTHVVDRLVKGYEVCLAKVRLNRQKWPNLIMRPWKLGIRWIS